MDIIQIIQRLPSWDFSALLPKDITLTIYCILPPLVFLVEAGWNVIVALMPSAERPRSTYLKIKFLFEKTAGFAMSGLGLKLISSAMED